MYIVWLYVLIYSEIENLQHQKIKIGDYFMPAAGMYIV